MPGSLRTRLFVMISVVLAAAVAAAAMLSRQATLVEVREIVTKPDRPLPPEVAASVERAVMAPGEEGLDRLLEAAAPEIGRGLLLVDPDARRVVAASHPMLRYARVRRATADGHLVLETGSDGASAVMEVRGVAPHRIAREAAEQTWLLFAVPEPDRTRPAAASVPRWVATTTAIGMLAVLLTFLVSRRVLGPVSALTRAVERLEGGDLSARVERDGRDGDEIGTLTRGFNRMVARLEEQERLRRQLVTDVAHELRSPVTNLRCGLEAVQDGLAPLDRAAVDGFHDEVLYLQRLIADLQDLSLAESGRLELRRGLVDVAEIARRAAAAVSSAPGAPIVVAGAAGDARVRGDEARLEQVFRNLLSNARRHTPPDGTIEVSVERLNGTVRARVRDSGEGIAAEHLPHLFDRFYRADGSRSRATGGAGLGLAIARQLVTTHGGRLGVVSDGPGLGATFTVELPTAD